MATKKAASVSASVDQAPVVEVVAPPAVEAAAKPNVTKTGAPRKGSSKGQARPNAAFSTIDFDSAAEPEELRAEVKPRESKWGMLLNELYTATEEGKVPRNAETGMLKFVKLGHFSNIGGARTQVRAFESRGYSATYEFKTVTVADGSDLWARVREDVTDAE